MPRPVRNTIIEAALTIHPEIRFRVWALSFYYILHASIDIDTTFFHHFLNDLRHERVVAVPFDRRSFPRSTSPG